MNDSSTSVTRPGRHSAAQLVAGVQGAGRVGRVADDDQVGVVGDVGGAQLPRRIQDDPARLAARGAQRHLRLGERRVHADRAPWPERRGEPEGLAGAVEEHDLVGAAAVALGDGGDGGRLVGIGAEVAERGGHGGAQPRRRAAGEDVDGEVVAGAARELVAVQRGRVGRRPVAT